MQCLLKQILEFVQGFFAIDVLSTIPWDIVLTNETLGLVQLFKATKMIKLVRIIRVLKLVRILRLLKVRPSSYCAPVQPLPWYMRLILTLFCCYHFMHWG